MRALIVMLLIWLAPAVLMLAAGLWIVIVRRFSPPAGGAHEPNVKQTEESGVDRKAA